MASQVSRAAAGRAQRAPLSDRVRAAGEAAPRRLVGAGAALASPGSSASRADNARALPELLARAGRGQAVAAPAALRQRIEAATGGSLAGVRLHTGAASQAAAQALRARAFTVGSDVHFGAGQYQPGQPDGDRLVAHELVHTLQQGPGAAALQTKLAISQPGDRCEREADRIADAVVTGSPAAASLPVTAARDAVTRVEIKNGDAKFNVDPYTLVDPDDGKDTARHVGVDIDITYTSADALRSDKIAFVQTMKVTMDGKPYLFENEKPRATKAKSSWTDYIPFFGTKPEEEGWAVDRLAGRESPNYGQDNGGTAGGNTRFGYRKSASDAADAWMHDGLSLPRAAGEKFTVDAVAFALDETHGAYLGGVTWGVTTDKAGKSTLKASTLASSGNPGGSQKQALEKWNEQAELKDVSKRNDPNQKKVAVP